MTMSKKNMKTMNEVAGIKLVPAHLTVPRSPDLIFNLLYKTNLIFNLLPSIIHTFANSSYGK